VLLNESVTVMFRSAEKNWIAEHTTTSLRMRPSSFPNDIVTDRVTHVFLGASARLPTLVAVG
jgi:hypothetical protein